MSRAKGKRTPQRPWQPLERAAALNHRRRDLIAAAMAERGLTDEQIAKELNPEAWLNDQYVVMVDRADDGHVTTLSIRRVDRKAPRDWRHFQRIKNELAGPDVEAVELYPAESRLYDTANQFWLWCLPPGETFPFGFVSRIVSDTDEAERYGAVQRPLEDDARIGPALDLTTGELVEP